MQAVRTKMNPVEAAKYIGCSYGYLLKLVRAKGIPSLHLGNRVFFFQDSLDRWLEEIEMQSTEAEDETPATEYGTLCRIQQAGRR